MATKKETKKTNNIHLTVAEDIGNGYLKTIINNQDFSAPAHAVKRYNTGREKPIPAKYVPEAFKEDVYNHMDLTITSPLVLDSVRRIYGKNATTSGSPLEEFDVFSPKSKAEVDLLGVLLLGSITSHVLQEYWKDNDEFPSEELNVTVDLAVALPIMEFVDNENTLRIKLLNNGMPHITAFNNFDKPIVVKIKFTTAIVKNEGEAAQKRIQTANDAFKEYLIQDARNRFEHGELDDVTGDDIVNLENTLNIDIGEGTIDFAVFSNGEFNQKASRSVNHGYGIVLENALEILQGENYTYKSRKEISEMLAKSPSPFSKKLWNHVKSVVDAESSKFTDEIVSDTSKIYTNVGSFIEAIFVSGGGSGPLEEWLFPKLQDLMNEYGQDQAVPIIYLDSSYSRYLNATGLYSILKNELKEQ